MVLLAFRLIMKSGFEPPLASYVVQSGSMEPSIMTGDIILIRPESEYALNDVITFRDQKKRVVTHRISDIQAQNGKTIFLTKGDANRSVDIEFVPLENVVGKVQLTVPKIGFLVSFAKTMPGIILFVIIPATIVIYDELGGLRSTIRQKRA
ncbi:MAG: signal peptidase I [Candidatus Pacebacteria bacterium RIFCSPHIGHO2_01_FULL_46_16]|nr:MAG: signal peptidase I [Candidatus Pacebacteria bacterium RIFCSPHIGHO2_01_FULL_46_16]OGJ21212.1 MAG: signal peptidase I [Candidatus Pacebacteria bacterium RIFCSPHIGHO2_02_FULL_46_9]OGJ38277.1 MAG: signal peptidase I [Candidatus Pacebacteria bacterium RIFCSPLOWO2_01_FULL_47_12]